MPNDTVNQLHFAPEDVRETSFVVHATSHTGFAYGRCLENIEGQVFIPQSVALRFNMTPGDSFRARVLPNYPDKRDLVPWRILYIYPKDAPKDPVPSASATVQPALTDQQLKDRVDDIAMDGRVWTTREVFKEIHGRDINYTVHTDKLAAATIGNHLRALCRKDVLWRLELFKHGSESAYAVFFSSDPEALRPEGY